MDQALMGGHLGPLRRCMLYKCGISPPGQLWTTLVSPHINCSFRTTLSKVFRPLVLLYLHSCTANVLTTHLVHSVQGVGPSRPIREEDVDQVSFFVSLCILTNHRDRSLRARTSTSPISVVRPMCDGFLLFPIFRALIRLRT